MSGKNSHKSYVLFQRGFLVTGFEAKRIYFSTCRKNNRCKILFIFTRKKTIIRKSGKENAKLG